jgi:hypothetical protein
MRQRFQKINSLPRSIEILMGGAAISRKMAGLRFIDSIVKVNQLPETAAMAEEGRWFILLFVGPAVFLFVYAPPALDHR